MARGTGGAPGRHAALRESLVDHGRRMVHDGLVDGVSGNLSARAGDLIAITPSGVPYQDMAPADICLVRPADGSTAAGGRPSTETPMHLAVYRATDAAAIVHTHSPFVGGFNWSSQHLDLGVLRYGCREAPAGDSCDARADAVAR